MKHSIEVLKNVINIQFIAIEKILLAINDECKGKLSRDIAEFTTTCSCASDKLINKIFSESKRYEQIKAFRVHKSGLPRALKFNSRFPDNTKWGNIFRNQSLQREKLLSILNNFSNIHQRVSTRLTLESAFRRWANNDSFYLSSSENRFEKRLKKSDSGESLYLSTPEYHETEENDNFSGSDYISDDGEYSVYSPELFNASDGTIIKMEENNFLIDSSLKLHDLSHKYALNNETNISSSLLQRSQKEKILDDPELKFINEIESNLASSQNKLDYSGTLSTKYLSNKIEFNKFMTQTNSYHSNQSLNTITIDNLDTPNDGFEMF